MLLDEALKKLVELNIAVIDENKYKYSVSFENIAKEIIANPPGKLRQIRMANEAGRKLIPHIIALATSKPSVRDIQNIVTGYVCLKIHINIHNIDVDSKLVPDLAYAVWYLNDHEPTTEEVEEWKSTSLK
jgi:hypothetical protein